MILTLLYIIVIASIILTATIGTILYRRYLADKPRRRRNAIRTMQMAAACAAGLAQTNSIRSTAFKPHVPNNIYKAGALAETIIKTHICIASIGKDMEPPPVYKYA